MKGPQVDVVVATNRKPEFLADSLLSVVRQTHREWRLTVVDDGCPDPDNLESVVRSIVPEATVVHQLNAGQAAARNVGCRLGDAPLITFLDDDDIWIEYRLALLTEALSTSPRCVAAYSGGWYMGASGTLLGEGWPADPCRSTDMLSGRVPIPRIITMVIRRESFEQVGAFNEHLRLGEDDDLILRLLIQGEFVAVPEQLVGYRRHSSNLTNASFAARRDASEELIIRLLTGARDRGDHDVADLLDKNRRAFVLGVAEVAPSHVMSHFRSGRWSEGVGELWWSLRRAPLRTLRSAGGRVGRLCSTYWQV